MIIMPANNTGIRVGYLAGRFPGKIGHLLTPRPNREAPGPFEFIPYAIDNGVFAGGADWQERDFFLLLDWARLRHLKPHWVIVPDAVGDKAATLFRWRQFADRVAAYGWPLAFAVQDGMTETDVPSDADVVFVGGSTTWKWRTMSRWCSRFERVHVGRVNSYRRLWQCHEAGAESIDGTGWCRGDQRQWRGLLAYLEESTGQRKRTLQECLELTA